MSDDRPWSDRYLSKGEIIMISDWMRQLSDRELRILRELVESYADEREIPSRRPFSGGSR